MTDKKVENLRKRAEAKLNSGTYDVSDLSKKDIQKILYELSTHQIELEMQNEELRRSQVDLQSSQKEFSDLYDFAPVGYLTLSDKNLISKVNLTTSIILGIKRSSLRNQPMSAFIYSEDQDIYYKHRKTLLETQKDQTCELRLLKGDGTLVYVKLESVINYHIDGDSGHFRTMITDISDKKLVEVSLHKAHEELQVKALRLEEANIALKVLMRQRETDKKNLEKVMLFKVKELLLPYIEKVQGMSSSITMKTCLEIIEKNLREITTPFAPQLGSDLSKLTPAEIKITDFIKHGKSNKEIAAFLNLSPSTVTTHRQRIRKKARSD